MAEDFIKQAQNLIKNSKNIAILMPLEVTLDEYCSAIALKAAIQKHGGTVSVFSSSENIPLASFLSSQVEVRKQFSRSDQFSIKISSTHAKPGEIRYEVEPDGVVVFLKTTSGEFLPEDVSVLPIRQKFDLFISLGVSRFEQLGNLYTDNASVIFETPNLNIDNKAGNEYFGTVNAVNLTASSISEIVYEIFSDSVFNLDEENSTAILAGIIYRTYSFRGPRTTPKTLLAAAKLIDSGAKHQKIIQYLFKTKPFPVLQLWGRALARSAVIPADSFMYTVVTKSDLEKTSADEKVLPEVLRDLIEMVSDYNIVALIAEMAEGHQVLIAGMPHTNLESIATKLGAAIKPAQPLFGQFQFVNFRITGKNTTELQELLQQLARSK